MMNHDELTHLGSEASISKLFSEIFEELCKINKIIHEIFQTKNYLLGYE